MFLYRRKIHGKSIKWPEKLPNAIEPEVLAGLVERLRNGDKSVITEIVNSHLQLAINIASQYASATGEDGYDYVSEAWTAIVKACEASEKLNDNNIGGYIVRRIHQQIGNYIRKQRRRTYTSGYVREPIVYMSNLLEINEILDMAVKTEMDRVVILLCKQQYNLTEIADQLGVSFSNVQRVWDGVRKRFDSLYYGNN